MKLTNEKLLDLGFKFIIVLFVPLIKLIIMEGFTQESLRTLGIGFGALFTTWLSKNLNMNIGENK